MGIKQWSPYKKMLLAVFCLQIMALIIKSLSSVYSPLELVFFRGFISSLTVFLIYSNKKAFFQPKRLDWLVYRSLLGFAGLFCFFTAITQIKLANAILLNKCSPFFVAIFSIFIFKDKISRRAWWCFFLAFVGVALVVSPDFSSINKYAWIGFLSAIFSGLAYNVVKKCRIDNSSSVVVFYFGFITAVLSGISGYYFTYYKPVYKICFFRGVDSSHWIPLIVMGIFSYLGQYFLTEAYGGGIVHKVAIFQYSGIIISVFMGFLLFGEMWTFREFGGALLIILALYQIHQKEEK